MGLNYPARTLNSADCGLVQSSSVLVRPSIRSHPLIASYRYRPLTPLLWRHSDEHSNALNGIRLDGKASSAESWVRIPFRFPASPFVSGNGSFAFRHIINNNINFVQTSSKVLPTLPATFLHNLLNATNSNVSLAVPFRIGLTRR